MTSPINETFDIDVVCGFEGPEKRLEIDFVVNAEKPTGLRAFDRDQWQELLNLAKCTIISQTSNDHFDSYVLSESSLFVYPYKVILKTCGTTTLLKTVGKFIEYAAKVESKPEFLVFTRKNLNFPHKQHFPHTNFDNETEYLNNYFHGESYTLGSAANQDHWFMYVADLTERHTHHRNPEQTLEIMMSNLDRSVMSRFYKGDLDAKQTTHAVGIDRFLPGSISDEVLFNPCGYSVNGLAEEAYYTIHVTPEAGFSFVSFETNLAAASYTKLVDLVVSTFKPGNFCVTVFNDKHSPSGPAPAAIAPTALAGYDLVEHDAPALDERSYHVSFWSFTRSKTD